MPKEKKYRKRKYNDGSIVIYTTTAGQVCTCNNEDDAKLVLNALNHYDQRAHYADLATSVVIDLEMLQSGQWVPDESSCEASINLAVEVRDFLR